MLSKEGEIRRDEACLDYAGSDPILYPCHGSKGNQYWEYEHAVSSYMPDTWSYIKSWIYETILLQTRTLRHGSSRKCLAINASKDKLVMEVCDLNEDRQRWKFGTFHEDKAKEAGMGNEI